jgi:chromosome segregation ATPase
LADASKSSPSPRALENNQLRRNALLHHSLCEKGPFMSDNIVLEHLRHIRGQLDGLKTDMLEIKERIGSLEVQYASLSRRVDRLAVHMDLVKRRLDLVEA